MDECDGDALSQLLCSFSLDPDQLGDLLGNVPAQDGGMGGGGEGDMCEGDDAFSQFLCSLGLGGFGGGLGQDAGSQEDDAGVDAGAVDAGPDAGEVDAGEDAGEMDAGDPDAGEMDAGDPDAGDSDAGDPDAGEDDAGDPDADDAGDPDADQEE